MSGDEELGLRLPADRDADQRLLRRHASGQQPVRRKPRLPRRARRASASGTSRRCTTASGTTTSPRRPMLVDITVDGRRIKAVVQVSKQAFVYVFDRKTGKPVWPIEERPVPQGRRARRVVFADAAVSDQAAGLRSAGRRRSTTSSTSRRSCGRKRSRSSTSITMARSSRRRRSPDGRAGRRARCRCPATVGGADWNGAGVRSGDRHARTSRRSTRR